MRKSLILSAMFAISFIACARPALNVDSLAREQRVVLDVSRYQGKISYDQVTQSSLLKWIYIKATEGMNTDPMFLTNAQESKAEGMHVGVYCFFSEKSGARAQAAHFLNTIKSAGVEYDLIPMVNVETLKTYSPAQLVDSLQVFVDCLEAEFNCKPLIYTGEHFFLKYLKDFAGYPLWIAKYSDKAPDIGGVDYILWQISESGIVNGIKGPVDVSVFMGKHRPRDIKLPSSKSEGGSDKSPKSKKSKKKDKRSSKNKEKEITN